MKISKNKINYFERHPRATITAVIVVSIFVLDVAAANLYKVIFGHSLYTKSEANKTEKSYRIKSEIYHHDLKKNTFVEGVVWGNETYSVSTDSLGFKSASVRDTPKVSTMHRILFIGDSFTEGIGLEYSKTFVGIIAADLRQKNIDVLNAAVSSYSPIIYWRKVKYLIEEVGLKFNELVVYIDLSDIQDEADKYRLSKQNTVDDVKAKKRKSWRQQTLKPFLKRNSVLMNVSRRRIFQNTEKNNPEFALNVKRVRWTLDKELFDEYGKVGLEKAAYYMDQLILLARTHGIRLTVAVYPWPDQIFSNDLNSIQVSFWREWTKHNGVCFINNFPLFIKPNGSDSDNKLTISDYYIRGDIHWNEKGHRLIADTFLSKYRNLGKSSALCH